MVIRCAHGDTVTYPLAWVELTVQGVLVKVEAALSDTLPTPVLLGRDVPELPGLLNQGGVYAEASKEEEAMAVTRAGSERDSTAQEATHGTRERALKSDAERQDPDKEGATTTGQEGKEEERNELEVLVRTCPTLNHWE